MSHSSLPNALASSSDHFLRKNPELSSQLLAELDHNLDRVKTLLEPALTAPERCQSAEFYIQAVTTGRKAFLITNLSHLRGDLVTETASNWLIGRNSTCDITIRHLGISRFHAAIGFSPSEGFYITDLNSANGSWVNKQRLEALQRRPLQDGDLIRLASYRFEFFVSGHVDPTAAEAEAALSTLEHQLSDGQADLELS